MNEKVLTTDKCEELVALGLDMSDSSMVWIKSTYKDKYKLRNIVYKTSDRNLKGRIVPTYTLQDILKRLWVPIEIIDPLETYNSEVYEFRMGSVLLDREGHHEVYMRYAGDCHILHEVRGKSENILELAFDMLKWRILNESDL